MDLLAFRDISIQRKLTRIIMLTSSVALVVASAFFMTIDVMTMRSAKVADVSALAEIIGANCTAALPFSDENSARSTLATLKAKPRITRAAIYPKNGRAFASYTRARAEGGPIPAAPGPAGPHFEGGFLAVFQPIVLDRERIGTVY